jgi:lipoprotein-anchoring transpeptidase ErfK/SrfK
VQRRSTPRGSRTAVCLTTAALLLTAACSHGDDGSGVTPVKAEPGAPQVTIAPGDGTKKARPEKGITVKVANGRLEAVTVTAQGKKVPGKLSADRTKWRTERNLTPGASYAVSATARNDAGKTTNANSKFKALKAANVLSILSVTPNPGETVGVGMPITVTFNRPVGDRKAVEKALEVRSQRANQGAWYWVNDQTVIFRTKKFWGANQKIGFAARLTGVKSGKDTYGTDDVTRKLLIGDSHIITVNTKTHRLTIRRNGKLFKTVGVSAGRGGLVRNGVDVYKTTSGVHLTMGKSRVERMTSKWMGVTNKKDPRYYDEKIPFAVRISSSGEFIHSMASTVWAQGRQNVSHGCVNSPPAFAQWFFGWSYLGDVVNVTGSGRGLDPFNGWSYWEMSWKSWVEGSAFDKAVSTVKPKPKRTTSPSVTPSSPATSTAPPAGTSSY